MEIGELLVVETIMAEGYKLCPHSQKLLFPKTSQEMKALHTDDPPLPLASK
uniref:Uncharacterized protein n=1 Tax=Oryza sativa subsp. japonica TaxID=39947 RepID=Q67VL4_ORYSJ|nr:hypothetical protein [Oryza sativa Japonica Group]